MEIKLEELKVAIKIIENQKMKAIIALDFGDFKVKGFRIRESEYENQRGEKLWLTPPSYVDSGGRYHPIFYTPNKELWQKIENKILDEYHKENEKYWRKRMNSEKEESAFDS